MRAVILTLACVLMLAAGNVTAATYVLRVDGLACPYCAYGVEKKLTQLPGVEGVSFDLEKGEVRVKVAEDVTLSDTELSRLVSDAGFTLRGVRYEE